MVSAGLAQDLSPRNRRAAVPAGPSPTRPPSSRSRVRPGLPGLGLASSSRQQQHEMSSSGWSLCDKSEQPDATAVAIPGRLHPSCFVEQLSLSQLLTCHKNLHVIHQLALLIAGDKPDRGNMLLGAKPELLVQARLVLLDNRTDLLARRDALLLVQWCAAEQPVVPKSKVKEEVQYYRNIAQHGRFPQTRLWACGALVMLASQPLTQLQVIGDEGSALILTSLMREALTQPNVQLHILAQCARFISHVTSLPGQEQLLQLCIHQLTEPLLLLLGGGDGTAAEACGALVALMKAQPQATAAAVTEYVAAAGGEGAKTSRCGVAAVVAALERELGELAAAAVESRQAAGAPATESPAVEEDLAAAAGKADVGLLDSAFSEEAAAGDEAEQAAGKGGVSGASGSEGQQEDPLLAVGQPLPRGGQPPTCLASSLLALLRRLLDQAGVKAASRTHPVRCSHQFRPVSRGHRQPVGALPAAG